MSLKTERITVAVTGSAGSAGGTATSRPIMGLLLAVHIDYTSQPATADVTVASAGSVYPAMPLLTVTNNATDGWYLPRRAACDPAGGALTAYEVQPVADAVVVTVAQGDPGSVVATLVFEE
jgi:hypothetical protein